MKLDIQTKRDHEDLIVDIQGIFVIPYEGSSEWLEKLQKFIDEKSI